MQLNDILADAQDQDRGREFELTDPVTGKPTGLKLRIAGPDSATQNRARLQLSDDLADSADQDGRVSAEVRERLRIKCLAACVLGWEIEEDGQPVPFSQANVIRLLNAVSWVQAQVDDFASNRAAFRGAV
ncbi:hypothetical protein [Sedimentitalea todarodis]|uniref:Tail assembly chaperone n=1 Tax=Sedimentitalea todarodis TaxID=1631240 RepID=A0ABU3VHX6_9RHOB|nr:hypothetical protein [Sedimentitalea todarodis]MDU9005754.1 hypothetical protein [Sedimentitalea todarodis]